LGQQLGRDAPGPLSLVPQVTFPRDQKQLLDSINGQQPIVSQLRPSALVQLGYERKLAEHEVQRLRIHLRQLRFAAKLRLGPSQLGRQKGLADPWPLADSTDKQNPLVINGQLPQLPGQVIDPGPPLPTSRSPQKWQHGRRILRNRDKLQGKGVRHQARVRHKPGRGQIDKPPRQPFAHRRPQRGNHRLARVNRHVAHFRHPGLRRFPARRPKGGCGLFLPYDHRADSRQGQNPLLHRRLKFCGQRDGQAVKLMLAHQTADFPGEVPAAVHYGKRRDPRSNLKHRIDQAASILWQGKASWEQKQPRRERRSQIA